MRLHPVFLLLCLLPAACARNEEPQYQAGLAALQAGNYAEAYCHWRSQADRQYAPAELQIGWLFANGQGMALNEARALHWWLQAARHGSTDGQFAVARAYLDGIGVKASPDKAAPWLLRALRGGEDEAGRLLRELAGQGVEPALQAVAWVVSGPNWRRLGGVRPVTADSANLRAKPNVDGDLVMSLPRAAEVVELHAEQDWVRVAIPGRRDPAWIYASLLGPEQEP
jgi:TPR repeat protein